ncbi:MAG: tetratricopeptide repeat protein, partial [Rickettsiaceae bacterium]|nr:tetratricopeptide repeat protein [Rickettsiaceae bacterium]
LAYDEAIRLKPEDNEFCALAYCNKGVALEKLLRHEDAIKAYDEAIRLKQDYADAYFNKGNALEKLSRHTDAISAFDEAIRLEPNDALAYNNKGIVLRNLSRYEDAIAAFDEAIRLEPNDALAYNNKGIALRNLSRYEEAAMIFLEIGNVLDNLSRYLEAIRAYDEAIKLKPDLALAYYNKGAIMHKMSRYNEAVTAFDEAIRLKPEDREFCTKANNIKGIAFEKLSRYAEAATAYLAEGIAFDQLFKYEEAIIAYDKAIRLAPNDAGAYNIKGLALYNLARYEEAIEVLDAAISLRPDLAEAYNSKGLALMYLSRYEEASASFLAEGTVYCNLFRYINAISACDKAIVIAPNNADAYNSKGLALIYLERYEEAIEVLDAAISLRPDLAEAYNSKGLALMYLSRYEEASASFLAEGTVYCNLSRYEEAIRAFDQVIMLAPNDPDVQGHKGLALIYLERYEEAIIAFDEAIRLKSEDKEFCAVAYRIKGASFEKLSRHDEAAVAFSEEGNALCKLSRHDEAIIAYDEAIRLKQEDNEFCAKINNNKGLILHNLSRHDEAITAYDEAIWLKPDYAEAYYNKGATFLILARYVDAIKAYDEAIRLKPDYAEAYNDKGLALRNLSRYEEATKAYDEAIRVDDKVMLYYLNKAQTLQKMQAGKQPEEQRKIQLQKQECLNKAYEISLDKSLLNSNKLSKANIVYMNNMFDERSKLLEKFKDLSYEVNELKKDGIDTSSLDQNLSDIQAQIIESVEVSEAKEEALLEPAKREGRTSRSSSLRITSNEDLQEHLAHLYEMMEQTRLENLRLRQEFEREKQERGYLQKITEEQQEKIVNLATNQVKLGTGQEEQQHKIESLDKSQIDIRKIVDEDRARIDLVEQDRESLDQTLNSKFESLQKELDTKQDDQKAILINKFQEFGLTATRDQQKIINYFDSFVSSLEKDFLVSKLLIDGTFTIDTGGLLIDTASALMSMAPGGEVLSVGAGKWNDFVKSADLKKAATKINHLAATIPEICDFAGDLAIRIIHDKTYRDKILNLENNGEFSKEKTSFYKKIKDFYKKAQEEFNTGLYGEQYKSIQGKLAAIDVSKIIEKYLKELKAPSTEQHKEDLADIFAHIITQESAENNTSGNNNHTSAMAQVNLESLNQNDPNKKPTVNSKTYVISKITYNNPLLNFLAKEENEEIQNQIINKHGSRGLSKLIDIFEPKDSAENRAESAPTTDQFLASLLGSATQEFSELDQA